MSLLYAAEANDLDEVNRLLLDPRVDVNQIGYHGHTPLIYAAKKGNIAIGLALIRRGADVNKANKTGATPLFACLVEKKKDFIVLLLENHGINVNVQTTDSERDSILMAAVVADSDLDVIQMLLESGADPNLASRNDTPLDYAIMTHKLPIAKLLILYGADVNQCLKSGYPLLYRVVNRQMTTILKYILTLPQLDIDQRVTSDGGQTALMCAATWLGQNNEMFTLLVNAGADPFIKNNAGQTASDYIRTLKQSDVDLVTQAQLRWTDALLNAKQALTKKFIVARRLWKGVKNVEGTILELRQKELPEYIVRRAEYDQVCKVLQNKPAVIALAQSLLIPTFDQSKIQLCQAIGKKLII
jgi:ankyrin repeat protein